MISTAIIFFSFYFSFYSKEIIGKNHDNFNFTKIIHYFSNQAGKEREIDRGFFGAK